MVALVYPLPRRYPITTNFGALAAVGGGVHYATDIGAPFGVPVLAAASGVVTFSGWNLGGGNVIKIDHGGFSTEYAHLALRMPRVGQQVAAGNQIGTVGSTGLFVTGAHLHFALWIDGTPESDPRNNPMLYLGGSSGTVPVGATLTGGPAEGSAWCYPSVGEALKGVTGHPPAADGSCPAGWYKRGYAPNLAPTNQDIIGGAFGLVVGPILTIGLNVATVAGGLFLVYKGVVTILKP